MADPDEPDDVDEIPPETDSDVSDDVTQVMRLLTWARHKGHTFGALRVGLIEIGGYRDTRPRFESGGKAPTSILEDYGFKEER